MQGIVKKVVDFLEKYSLQDKTIIVGFSGGFDSMCLLDVLSKIKNLPEFIDLNVVAAHYNHNWRGEEALREQEVCRIFASAKGMIHSIFILLHQLLKVVPEMIFLIFLVMVTEYMVMTATIHSI